MRSELHFSLGSSLDFAITVRARPHLDSAWGQALLPSLWVGSGEATGVCFSPKKLNESKHDGFWVFAMMSNINSNYLEDEMKRLLELFMSAERSKIMWKILMQKSDFNSLLPFVKKKKKKTKGSCVLNSHTHQGLSWLPLVTRPTIKH